MKKIFGLAIVSMTIFACNDTQSPSINEDTRDTSSTVIETPPPASTDNTYMPVVYRTGKAKKDGKEIVIEEGVVINREGNFFDKTGRAIENAWDATKDGVKKAGSEIEKGAEKAGDKVNDAVDDDDDKK